MICDQVDPTYSLTRSTVRLILLPEVNPIIALLLVPSLFLASAHVAFASMHSVDYFDSRLLRFDFGCGLHQQQAGEARLSF